MASTSNRVVPFTPRALYIKRLTVTHKQTTFNTLHQTWTLSSSKVSPLVYRVRLTDADPGQLIQMATRSLMTTSKLKRHCLVSTSGWPNLSVKRSLFRVCCTCIINTTAFQHHLQLWNDVSAHQDTLSMLDAVHCLTA